MADKNYKSYWGTTGLRLMQQVFPNAGINPKEYSDVLKFSMCEDTVVDGCIVYGGRENCTDAVRGRGYIWRDCHFIMQQPGAGAVTVKGSIDGATFDQCTFEGHGNEYDIELGQFDNYWYPFRKPTRNIVIRNCGSLDGQPIKVTVWNAEMPKVLSGNVRVIKVPWIVWVPYFLFRYVVTKIQQLVQKITQ